MSASRRSGAGCLLAFATPFVAVGIYCAVAAIRLANIDGATKIAIGFGCAAFAFGGAGFGIAAWALWGSKRIAEDQTLRALHPEEPWLWNAEWGGRRIADRSRAGTIMLWGFALLWNAIASPVLVFLPQEVQKGNRLMWVALLFPIVGVVLLLAAVRATLRALRFRESVLVLDTLPAPIGGTLRGTIEVPHALPGVTAILLRLTATTRWRSAGETTEATTVHEEREIEPAAIRQTGTGSAIPIEIPIPASASPTDANQTWTLVVDAELPGIDYSATFEVPVFRTAASEFRSQGTAAPLSAPLHPRSFVERTTAAGHELYFPPFRAPALAFWSLLCTLFAIGATLFTFAIHVPLVLSILFALVALAMLFSTLGLFFASRTVILAPDRLVTRRRILWTSERSIPYADIANVRSIIAAHKGARPYYHFEIRTRARKRLRVAKFISSKREAEWVASRLRR